MSRTLALLALLTSALYPRQADACTALPPSPVRLFPSNSKVPGNLVYFKVLAEEPGALTLTTQDGTLVASSVRTIGSDRVFAPDAPVPAGTALRLTYQLPITYGGTIQTLEFSTTDSAAVSLRAPALELVDTLVEPPDAENGRDMTQRIEYTTPDANGSLAHLIDYSVTIDGHPLHSLGGAVWPTLQLDTVCGQTDWSIDTCGSAYRAPEGDHVLIVTPQVVGLEQQPGAVELSVQSSCDAGYRAQNPDTDSADAVGETQANPKLADEGCSLSGRSHGRGNCAWASLLALAALLRRRSQARSSL